MPLPKASFYEDMNDGEWECVYCGCINEENEEHCWNCNATQDGWPEDVPEVFEL